MKYKFIRDLSTILIITSSWQQLLLAKPDYTYEVQDGLRPRAMWQRKTLECHEITSIQVFLTADRYSYVQPAQIELLIDYVLALRAGPKNTGVLLENI